MRNAPPMNLAVFVLALCPLLTNSIGAQSVGGEFGKRYTLDGIEKNYQLGYSVAGAGDVNGDGFDDVIVGARGGRLGCGWQGTGGAGTVYVYSGKDGTELWRLNGADFCSITFGQSVAGAGDVNRDGFDDVIVGASVPGAAYVFSGKDGTEIWQFDGPDSDQLGYSVAGVGDVNLDGFPDVIVGAPRRRVGPIRTGSALIYSGKNGTKLWQFDGEVDGDRLGSSVAGAGDVNKDGFPDVIVAASSAFANNVPGSGSVYVYSGKDGARIWKASGTCLFGSLGDSVAGAGDVNGDGFDDVIVGSTGVGCGTYVYSGNDGTEIWRFPGYTVAGVGDINKDGFADVITGNAHDSKAGSASVYSGKDGTKLWQFDGEVVGDGFGWSVAGAGDVNQDGSLDVIVGAVGAREGAGSAVIYVYRPIPQGAYGTGLAGSGNIAPRIRTGGEVARIGSSNFKIEVVEALGGTLCVFAASLTRASIPLGGGTLYGDFLTPGAFSTWHVLTSGTFGIPGLGTATLAIQIPNDPTLVGFTTYWQGFVVDFGGKSPSGLSHTRGLKVTVVK